MPRGKAEKPVEKETKTEEFQEEEEEEEESSNFIQPVTDGRTVRDT
jgi:hypothetical protein